MATRLSKRIAIPRSPLRSCRSCISRQLTLPRRRYPCLFSTPSFQPCRLHVSRSEYLSLLPNADAEYAANETVIACRLSGARSNNPATLHRRQVLGRHLQVVPALQVHPEFGTVTEEKSQPDCRIGGNRTRQETRA